MNTDLQPIATRSIETPELLLRYMQAYKEGAESGLAFHRRQLVDFPLAEKSISENIVRTEGLVKGLDKAIELVNDYIGTLRAEEPSF